MVLVNVILMDVLKLQEWFTRTKVVHVREEALFIWGGVGITADPGRNSYDPPLNDLFETDRNSYDPPLNRISDINIMNYYYHIKIL